MRRQRQIPLQTAGEISAGPAACGSWLFLLHVTPAAARSSRRNNLRPLDPSAGTTNTWHQLPAASGCLHENHKCVRASRVVSRRVAKR